jgi:hypothetical protein
MENKFINILNIYKQFKWVLGVFTMIPMRGSIRLAPLQLHETKSKSYKLIMAFVFGFFDFVSRQLRFSCSRLTDKRFHQMPKSSLLFSPLFRRM